MTPILEIGTRRAFLASVDVNTVTDCSISVAKSSVRMYIRTWVHSGFVGVSSRRLGRIDGSSVNVRSNSSNT